MKSSMIGAVVACLLLVSVSAEAARGRIGVKAAGGIRDWEMCRAMIEAGASRIGTSSGVEIFGQWRDRNGIR